MNSRLLAIRPCPKGEYLTWWLKSAARLTGDVDLQTLSHEIFGHRVGLDGMPSGLMEFHRQIGHLLGGIDDLLSDHTEFNLRCCGLRALRQMQQRERMLVMSHGPIRLARLPVLFEPSERLRRYCPECALEQISSVGFSFVDRAANAPFVSVCGIHGVALLPACGDENSYIEACQGERSKYQLACEKALSARMVHCLETSPTTSGYSLSDVLDLLTRSGWRDENGRFARSALVCAFTKFFCGAFSDRRLATLVADERIIDGALRNLVKVERGVHPIWCLLFRIFAENCGRQNRWPHEHANVGRVLLDEGRLRALLLEHRTLRAAAKVIHVSEARLALCCKRYGVERRWRAKFLRPEMISQIERAVSGGQGIPSVCQTFRVSLSSVYRVISAAGLRTDRANARAVRVESDKEAWLKFVTAEPELSRTQLRRRYCAVYERLRRYAPRWLKEHLPPPAKRNRTQLRTPRPSGLLAAMGDAAKAAVAHCDSADGRPAHRSVYRIRSSLRVNYYAFEVSRAAGSVCVVPESRRQFVERRVDWADTCWHSLRRNQNSLAKRASLRPRTIVEHYLEKSSGGSEP